MIPRDVTACSPQSRSALGVFLKAAALEGCRLALPVFLNYEPRGVTAYDCLTVQHFCCCSLFCICVSKTGSDYEVLAVLVHTLRPDRSQLIETTCLCLQSAGVKGVSQYSGSISAPLRQDILHVTQYRDRP